MESWLERVPRELDDLLEFLHFAPMLEHKELEEMHPEGVYPREGEERIMECLYQFAEWIVRGAKRMVGRWICMCVSGGRFFSGGLGGKVCIGE